MQERTFSRTRGAYNRHLLTCVNLNGNIIQHTDIQTWIAFMQAMAGKYGGLHIRFTHSATPQPDSSWQPSSLDRVSPTDLTQRKVQQ